MFNGPEARGRKEDISIAFGRRERFFERKLSDIRKKARMSSSCLFPYTFDFSHQILVGRRNCGM